jgi:hypothetical protein
MDIATRTVRRTVPVTETPAAGRPRWAVPALATAAVATAGAILVGAMEARLPVGPGGTSAHHMFPFFTAALGMAATAVATGIARRHGDRGWPRLLAAGGVLYALNAVLVAALTYAVTPDGRGWPLAALAWVENWLFMPADVIMFGLLPLCLPGGPAGRFRGWRRLAYGLAGLIGAGVLLGAFAAPQLDNTDHVANPLAVPALAPLAPFAILAYLAALFAGVLAAIVRHAVLLGRRDPDGRRVGRLGLPCAVGVLAAFVAQAALTPDGSGLAANLAAGAVLTVGGLATAAAGSRLAARRD